MARRECLQGDQEVPVKTTQEAARTRRDRAATRLSRLEAVAEGQPGDRHDPPLIKALESLQSIRAAGITPRPPTVSVRSTLITRPVPARRTAGQPEPELSDLHPPKGRPSPLMRLRSPNGIAHQVHLVALFVAQHERGHRSNAVVSFRTQMRGEGQVPGWVDLVVPTPQERDKPINPRPRSHDDRKRRQLTRALDSLEAASLVELPNGARVNRRYDRFQLLDEVGPRRLGSPLAYHLPQVDARDVIRVPVDFFLNGWVYALTFNEIALYLMLRHLAQRKPGPFEVLHEERASIYGLTKDSYASWWLLEHAGLIRVVVDVERRADGTVTGYDPKKHPEAHQFELTDEGLAQEGATQVTQALKAYLDHQPVGIARVAAALEAEMGLTTTATS